MRIDFVYTDKCREGVVVASVKTGSSVFVEAF